jgi:hypothetical protein
MDSAIFTVATQVCENVKVRGGGGENPIQRAQVEVEQIMQGQFQADLLSKWSLTGRMTCRFDRTVLQKSKLFVYMYVICSINSYAYD